MADSGLIDLAIEADMQRLQGVIRGVREMRNTINDYRSRAGDATLRTLPMVVVLGDDHAAMLLARYGDFVRRLAGCDALEARTDGVKPDGALTDMTGSLQVCVPARDLVDMDLVLTTQRKKLDDLRKQLASIEARMGNASYVRNAPPEIVAESRARMQELQGQIAALAADVAS